MIFENCLIQAPDGTNLSRCGLKKLNWYLKQGIADQIADNPPTIRLRFEPSGRRGLDDPMLMDGKPNICVVCGTTEDLTRHHLIPYSFIKHMRIEYKMDIIRDIFPVCRTCHNIYEDKSLVKRRELADRFGLPIYGIEAEQLHKVRKGSSAAAALLRHKEKIPAERREYLLGLVRDFIGKEEVTQEDLLAAQRHKITERDDYTNLSKYVAEHVGDYTEFATEWRQHFLDTMQPKYMPDKWKVDRQTRAEDVWVPNRVLKQLEPS